MRKRKVGWSVSWSHFQIAIASVSLDSHRSSVETCDFSDI